MGSESPRRRVQSGRADLLIARAAGLLPEAATLLGYQRKEKKAPLDDGKDDGAKRTGDVPLQEPLQREAGEQRNIVFYRVVERFEVAPEKSVQPKSAPRNTGQAPAGSWGAAQQADENPLAPRLGALSALLPRLRRFATMEQCLRELDVKKAVASAARAEAPRRIPLMRRRRWGAELCILQDRSPHLAPYLDDYAALYKDVSQLYPRGAIHEAIWRGKELRALQPSGVVLAFSDLGSLLADGVEEMAVWERYGRVLRAAGGRAVAILPGAPIHDLARLARYWDFVSLSGAFQPEDKALRDEALTQLLTLAAPAIRVEPGLLRELRLLLGRYNDSGLEGLVWQSDAIASPHPVAASFEPESRRRLLDAFAGLDADLRREALKRIWRWRSGGLKFVFAEEAKSLDPKSRGLLPQDVDKLVTDCFASLSAAMSEGAPEPETLGWMRRVASRLPAERMISHNEEERQALARLWRAAFPDAKTAPPGYDPALLEPSQNERTHFKIEQIGEGLLASPVHAETRGSFLAEIDARVREFAVEQRSFWERAEPPTFANAWGVDEFGAWFEFSIDGPDGPVTQRMRWIEPGRFLMGSPDKEKGRDEDKGPQHEVTIGKGYWLFDTACTQALWTAVMGSNPSQFKGEDRPVEQVSWNDANKFIEKLNARIPGLNLSLPSEAQWEYACRAGTTTPFSFGEDITPDQVNYDGNYPYRKGTKGLFRRETVAAGSLPANPWGLYDMHGNVWEWCADAWHGNYEGAPSNGSVWESEDRAARRVLRGGSWDGSAQRVRSAYRSRNVPDDRFNIIGFRCARVQDGAEPGATRRIRQAERRIAAGPSGEAERARIFAGAEGAAIFPRGGPFIIRSDCERLTVEPLTRPKWASAIGRDRYGLWTEFSIGDATQKMRWINPGRFLMGSPEGEQGRIESEGPRHEVAFARGFWLADTACTQELWMAVMGENPSRFKGDDKRPVETVSWNDAQNFFTRINERIPGLALGLPSEAQWEYACRAGTNTPFSFGENITPEQVNYDGNHPYAGAAKGLYREKTAPVASLPPNAWGLYEMHGNVWEWCADEWHDNYEGAPGDGSVWQAVVRQEENTAAKVERSKGLLQAVSGLFRTSKATEVDKKVAAERVLRGGSWNSLAQYVRSASRLRLVPGDRGNLIGFRCARVQA